MRRWVAYAATSTLVVAGVTGVLWNFVDGAARSGLGLAGGVAVVVQWMAFALLLALRDRENGLLLGMAASTAARFGALGVAGLAVSLGWLDVGAAALVLGLAGYLFALALLEAVFLQRTNGSRQAE